MVGMRLSPLFVPVLMMVPACSAPDAVEDSDFGDTTSNLSASGCSLSREQILGSVSPARQEAITRGFTWFDDKVPYNQKAFHNGYRTDCSGFVSMSWSLATPGETTASFGSSSKYPKLGSYEELVPGDAVNAAGHHVVMFLGWDDSAKSNLCVIEQECTKCGMQFHTRSRASMEGQYRPMRAPQFVNDTSQSSAPDSPADDPSASENQPPGDDPGSSQTRPPATDPGSSQNPSPAFDPSSSNNPPPAFDPNSPQDPFGIFDPGPSQNPSPGTMTCANDGDCNGGTICDPSAGVCVPG
jgi:hypothetical protein